MLLVGGGVGPPVMGVLAGICGLGNNSLFGRWVKNRSINIQRFLAIIWPWIFIIAVINGIFLVIGSLVLVYIFDVKNPDLFSNSFLFTMLFLILLIFAGPAHDIQNNREVCLA